MTYSEAQTEFSIRLYRWAKSALELETVQGFPRFKLSKNWSTQRCHFIQGLDPHSRKVFCNRILHDRHQNAVKSLGEVASAESESLLVREEVFRSDRNEWVRESTLAGTVATKRLATRREIKKAINAHFRAAFGLDSLSSEIGNRSANLRYRTSCFGWVLTTEFEFGRWGSEINCLHDIWTGQSITRNDPQVLFANCLCFQMNYGNEIGIGSGWEAIYIDDVELICASVIEHCKIMYEVIPALLTNLDLAHLTR